MEFSRVCFVCIESCEDLSRYVETVAVLTCTLTFTIICKSLGRLGVGFEVGFKYYLAVDRVYHVLEMVYVWSRLRYAIYDIDKPCWYVPHTVPYMELRLFAFYLAFFAFISRFIRQTPGAEKGR